ncbi:hypothetical protein BWQ96_01438 [Gracilariopsis chorda]|uniref:Uncharacterized protein n=1 Tax=Gracilariopsis chorda TaxID=448386 RepID=A0A2V3J429_9FLOR|nr:hypothetical protein BWQ96_01438 [Gracilariopsis chorda]|eukprot:PXF48882.1 hypothetical protein BWQ96_01438 [Gracilariopsis chorda]
MVRDPNAEEPRSQNGVGEQDQVLRSFVNVRLVDEAHTDSLIGTLQITQKTVLWQSSSSSQSQPPSEWTVNFTDINLHAMSTDESSGYPPSIYAQTGEEFKEVRMIPEESQLRELYDALCEGVARNGDAASSDMEHVPLETTDGQGQ